VRIVAVDSAVVFASEDAGTAAAAAAERPDRSAVWVGDPGDPAFVEFTAELGRASGGDGAA
jgi:hypothetical protein